MCLNLEFGILKLGGGLRPLKRLVFPPSLSAARSRRRRHNSRDTNNLTAPRPRRRNGFSMTVGHHPGIWNLESAILSSRCRLHRQPVEDAAEGGVEAAPAELVARGGAVATTGP